MYLMAEIECMGWYWKRFLNPMGYHYQTNRSIKNLCYLFSVDNVLAATRSLEDSMRRLYRVSKLLKAANSVSRTSYKEVDAEFSNHL